MKIGILFFVLGMTVGRQVIAATAEVNRADSYINNINNLLLNPYNADTRIDALVQALHGIDDGALNDLLTTMLDDNDMYRRRTAATAVGVTQRPQATPVLIKVMQRDKDWEVRRAAVVALGRMPKDDGINHALSARLKTEKNPLVLNEINNAGAENGYFKPKKKRLFGFGEALTDLIKEPFLLIK